ncbi:MAG: PKD domain-containing protein [Myxococcales bacterium]
MHRKWLWIAAALFSTLIAAGAALLVSRRAPKAAFAASSAVVPGYGRLAIRFERNDGQTDPRVRFIARASGTMLFLTGSEAVLALHGKDASTAVRMKFLDANPAPLVEGLDALPGVTNYFLGSDPAGWRTGVPSFGRVVHRGVYPGVEVIFHGQGRELEYDLVLEAGADPRKIRVAFEGADRTFLDREGNVLIATAAGTLIQRAPSLYQERGGGRVSVPGRYALRPDGSIGIELGAYDPALELVVDPVLAYSTFLGGPGNESGVAIAADRGGNSFFLGNAASTNFPVSNPVRAYASGVDAVVTKIDPTGSNLIWSTYLGGSLDDVGTAIALDASGNAYLAGHTRSTNFPVLNALQPAHAGGTYDAFVTKLGPTGAISFSTYLGGSGLDQAFGIALDATNSAYLTGVTVSADFPHPGSPFQSSLGTAPSKAFVTKLSADGSTLAYSTYLGGNATGIGSAGHAIAIDGSGRAYVTGNTFQFDFPTLNPLYGKAGSETQVFVTAFNATGSSLVYSTLLGSFSGSSGSGIAVDAAGNAVVVGSTTQPFPTTTGAYQTSMQTAGQACFVTRIAAGGSSLAYSTLLGASATTGCNAVALDAFGDAWLTGFTTSSTFPTSSPIQATYGGGTDGFGGLNPDAFAAALNPSGTALLFSSFLGGNGSDSGAGIALDGAGKVYLTGAAAPNFPTTTGALHTANAGGADAFITRIDANQYFFGGAGNQRGTAISIDSGAIYLSADTNETQDSAAAALVLKVPIPGGSPTWSLPFGSGTDFFGIAASPDAVYSGGYSYSLTTDLSGGKEVKEFAAAFNPASDAELWRSPASTSGTCSGLFQYCGVEFWSGLATTVESGARVVYAAGGGQPCSYSASLVAKYNSSGARIVAATDSAAGLTLFNSCDSFVAKCPSFSSCGGATANGLTFLGGSVYAAGSTSFSWDGAAGPVIWKYDTSLALQGRYKDGSFPSGSFAGITGLGGDLIAVGTESGQYLIERVDTSLNRVWRSTSNGAGALTGVAVTGNRLFAVGYTTAEGAGGADGVILEIDPSSGATLSKTLYGGAGDDKLNGVATDGTDLYAVGETRSYQFGGNGAGQNDVWLVRFVLPAVVVGPPVITAPTSPYSSTNPLVTVTGTAAPNASLTFFDGATQISTASADGSGNFSTGITFAYGLHSLTATQTASGQTSSASSAVSILITALPVVTAPAGQSANEGASVSYSLGSFTDASGDGPWTVTVSWGDGAANTVFSATAAGTIGPHSHTYLDNQAGDAPYTVIVQVTSAGTAGQTGQATFEVTVHDVAPSVTAPLGQNATEGVASTFDFGSFTDPGVNDAPWAVSVDWGDGPPTSAWSTTAAGSLTNALVTHAWQKAGQFTVGVKVTDKDGASGSASFTVTVGNVAPVVTAPGNGSASEGTAAAIALGSFTDASGDMPWSVSVDWGDGAHDSFQRAPPGSLGTLNHAWADSGSYTVLVTVTDSPGSWGTASFSVSIANVAPAATLSNSGPVGEGAPATVSFSNPFDPSTADTLAGFRYTFACAGTLAGSSYATGGVTPSASCTFPDQGTFSVIARVFDKDGGFTESSTSVVVENVAPSVTTPDPQTSDEAVTAMFDLGSFSDPGLNDAPWSVSVDWGDGTPADSFTVSAQGTLGARSHTYFDHGEYTGTINVTDKDGAATPVSFQVTVANVPPSVSAAAAQTSDEGAMAYFSLGSFADTLIDGPWTVSVDWGDKSSSSFPATLPGLLSANHTYQDDGTYLVAVSVVDNSGATGKASFEVSVANLAPIAGIQGARSSSLEGTALSLTAAVSDPGPADTATGFLYSWSVTRNGIAFVTGDAAAFGLTPDDDGVYVVTLTVTDKDGSSGSDSKTISVTDVAPTATASLPGAIDEGSSFVIALTFPFDPSTVDTAAGFTYAFDCGDGAGFVGTGGTSSRSCATSDEATRHVGLQIRDKDYDSGGSGSTSYFADVTVNGVAPTAQASIAGSTTITEGAAVTFALNVPFDPSSTDGTAGFHYSFACDDSAMLATSFASADMPDNVTCTYDDGPGTHMVTGRIFDEDSLYSDYQVTVNVLNAPPVPSIGGAPASGAEGAAVTLTASATDPGAADTSAGFGFSWNVLKNGALFASGSGSPFNFTPDDDGNYAVTLTVVDKDSGAGSATAVIPVSNVAPGATLSVTPGAVNEGATFTLSLMGATDPSSADTAAGFSYAFDCGDGTGFGPPTAAASRTCTANGSGTWTVRGSIADKDGGAHLYLGSVVVNDVAPTASFGGPVSVAEGGAAVFSFTNPVDPSGSDAAAGFHYAFDCAGGPLSTATWENSGVAASVSCAFDDGPAARTVTGLIFDVGGASTLYSAIIQVQNVAPTATLVNSGPGSPCKHDDDGDADDRKCDPVVISLVSPFDPSAADRAAALHYAFSCTGVSLAGATYASSGSGNSTDCQFAAAGRYTVLARIIDKDGGSTQYQALVDVGGRMTGGGTLAGGVSHGFELRCDHSISPERLEINWGRGQKFSLETMTSSGCTYDAALAPPNPEAQFNTLTGSGSGRLNGTSGYRVTFSFTDADARGLRDTAQMTIVSPSGATVFSAGGTLTGGHQEAHPN